MGRASNFWIPAKPFATVVWCECFRPEEAPDGFTTQLRLPRSPPPSRGRRWRHRARRPALRALQAIAPLQGFAAFVLGSLLAVVGAVRPSACARRSGLGRRDRARSWPWACSRSAASGGRPARRGLPRINITTDPVDPRFVYASGPATRPRLPTRRLRGTQRAAYPDLADRARTAAREAFEKARAARSLGWHITLADPPAAIEARDTSKLFR
jgi:hypothetical protein